MLVDLSLQYCGICHTDVHFADPAFPLSRYPLVPGHELAGIVTRVGRRVEDVKVGDRVGVGCVADSCQRCSLCLEGEEQACTTGGGYTMTYNYDTEHGHLKAGICTEFVCPVRNRAASKESCQK